MSWDWDENSVEIPKLFPDEEETVVNPRFEIFIHTNPDHTFAISMEDLTDYQNNTNYLIEAIMENILIRETSEDEDEEAIWKKLDMAPVECIKRKPMLILIDHETGSSMVAPYDTYH